MDKNTLRNLVLNKRKEYDNKYILEKSNIIKYNLLNNIDFNNINTVHIYLSKKKEVDTWNIIDYILNNFDTKIIVPKVNGDDLEHYYFDKNNLVKNKSGIYEPIDCKLFEKDSFDLIIIPLLIVNKRGYRVGYGGGYYDKFLSKYSGLKVGLSLEDPIDFKEEEHDIKLDKCIFSK